LLKDALHLRTARTAAGLKQAELAAAAGLARPTVERLEGQPGSFDNANIRTLRALETALLMRGVEAAVDEDGACVVRWTREA
jgi:transcriptional regulator with XRE-family HTH domain